MRELNSKVEAARDAILSRKVFQPQVAIVLGSGLGGLGELVAHPYRIPYAEIPHFPRTHAVGHAGQLVLGYLHGVAVVLMQGRVHFYEGWSSEQVTFGLRCMHALGAECFVATNAAGGLNARYRAGDLMVIDSHLDMIGRRGLDSSSDGQPLPLAQGVGRSANPYDAQLIEQVVALARNEDVALHRGCYLATSGPTYETRSEYRMFRSFGADAVGMSTVPEVKLASALQMSVLAFSVITNVASTDLPVSTTHDEVVDVGRIAGVRLSRLLGGLLEDWAGCPD